MALRVLFTVAFPLTSTARWLAPADNSAALDAQLKELRSALSSSANADPTAADDVVKPVVLAQQDLPGDGADDQTLEARVHEGLEREQQLMEQLHASETSSAWLADQLHNSTEQVQELERKRADVEKRSDTLKEQMKHSSDETAKQKVEVKKLHDHEKWLGKMVKKMLKADKELQKQTDGLEKQEKALKVENKEFLRRNEELAKGVAQSEQQLVETKKQLEDTKGRTKRQDTEKEALQKFFADKEAEAKQEEDALRAKVGDELKQREEKLKSLKAQFDAKEQEGIQSTQKQAAEEAREKDAEDKEAEQQVLIRNLQAEIAAVKAKNNQISAENTNRHAVKTALEDQINVTLKDVKTSRAAEKKAKDTICVSVKKKVNQAQRTRSLMHHALKDAVKLGHKLQKENSMLRQALQHTKKHLQSLMKRDSEASHRLQTQIEKLHEQLKQHEAIPVAPPQFDGPPADDNASEEEQVDQEEQLPVSKEQQEPDDQEVAAEDDADLRDEAEAGKEDDDSLEELPPRPLSQRLAMIQEESSAVQRDEEESDPRYFPEENGIPLY